MRFVWRIFVLFFVSTAAGWCGGLPQNPAEIYGSLFREVQRSQVFADQKTFVDCIPREAPARIVELYQSTRNQNGFDLKTFVRDHFIAPGLQPISVPHAPTLEDHLSLLWDQLRREPDVAVPGSSLLPLPFPYIIPGGRFREVYYWDSYFTMLGLKESGKNDLIEGMIRNFAYLEKQYGVIPNGNRTYFLSRSQPPFFSLMLDVLCEIRGPGVYPEFLPALLAEHAYWSDLSASTRHVVELPENLNLNRYYDRLATPRPEAFVKEEQLAARTARPTADLFRDLRAAAESGWDFSSRWMADGKSLETTETTQILPVDLNCLLYHLEVTIAKAYRSNQRLTQAEKFEKAAAARRTAIEHFFWSPENGYYFDYNLRTGRRSEAWTLAGIAPLFFKIAQPEEALKVSEAIESRFLKPGGVVTTLVQTGQQWDAPNGWPPLEYMTIIGLENYGYHRLAAQIASRWLKLNRDTYDTTGKMMEKYDVVDLRRVAGGGEYSSQDGFGWTNGVYLRLVRLYPESSKP